MSRTWTTARFATSSLGRCKRIRSRAAILKKPAISLCPIRRDYRQFNGLQQSKQLATRKSGWVISAAMNATSGTYHRGGRWKTGVSDALMIFAALYDKQDFLNIVTDFTIERQNDGKQKANPNGAGKSLLR